ncbi:ligand-binding sensor domain-containing protein [Saccharicrinis sp. 156]|uniref:ligand-binding sensor domain-containing protein n=1 Tax=Saccharicrinis sp. 156 TaxID=3417574 RepID=UPI003D33DFE3
MQVKIGHIALFVIAFVFIEIDGFAEHNYSFRHLSNTDGLSQNTVNCMYQDSKGFVWIGTQDGLNRYDGYEFLIFRHDKSDTTSISHSWIWDIYEDRNGVFWIATWHGLNRYDPNTGLFARYLPQKGNKNSMNGTRPTSICEDERGNLWIGTWGGGVNRFNPKTGNFTHFVNDTDDSTSLASNFVRSLYLGSNNDLWVGTWNGLSIIDISSPEQPELRPYKGNHGQSKIPSSKISSLLGDKEGNVWIGTLGGGISRHDRKTGLLTTFVHDASKNSISSNNITSLLMGPNGALWIGTVSLGIDIYDIKDSQFVHVQHDPDDRRSLTGNSINSLLMDRSGLVWIGAEGINIFNARMNYFSHFKHKSYNNNSLSNNKVTVFCEDHKGDIWIGTETGGLNYFCPSDGTFRVFKHVPGNRAGLSSNNISSIIEDKNQDLWIGTRGGGLNRFDTHKKLFRHYNESPLVRQSEGLDNINGLAYDSVGIIWIATYSKGLIKFDLNSGNFTNYRSNPVDSTTLSGDYLLRIYNQDQYLWLGSWGGGLSRMDKKSGSFQRYMSNANAANGLSDNIVQAINKAVIDGKEKLCVGTSDGLSVLDFHGGTAFSNYSIKDGLPSNVIYGILDDEKGNLWLSTNNGICKFNPDTREIKTFNIHNGLQGKEYVGGAYLKLRNGMFLFGGNNGFNLFYPDSIAESRYEPPVEITSFNVFNVPYFEGHIVPDSSVIKLSHHQNFFSFKFSALDFTNPANNRYQYILEGVDENWVAIQERRFVGYTNLDPGEYTFKVRGTNCDGIWSSEQASMEIIITPAIWQTIWFKLFLVVIVLAVLWRIYRYKQNRLAEMERLRISIASDLHDEVGASLTRISIHSEQIQNTDRKKEIIDASRKIGSISRDVIATMSDIVWSIDTRNDTIGDLLERMYDLAYTTFSIKDIAVSFSENGLDKDKKIKIDSRQNVYYIFKEAINNIVKYAQASEVKVSMENEVYGFNMQIKDNGIGFDISKVKKGNGLRNMKMRAERIGGELIIESDGGTIIMLRTRRL